MRPVALPALEALGGVVARAVAVVVDHVQDVALGPLHRHRVLVVGTVHVQVVVDADVDVVVAAVEPARGEGTKGTVRLGDRRGGGIRYEDQTRIIKLVFFGLQSEVCGGRQVMGKMWFEPRNYDHKWAQSETA